MTNQTAPKRYHPIHMTLHWLVTLLTFVLLFGGLFVFHAYQMPKKPHY